MTEKQMTELKADVKDLLNQLLIKLDQVETHDIPFNEDGNPIQNDYIDDYEEGYRTWDGKELVKKSDDEVYLGSVKELVSKLVEGKGHTAEYILAKYHTSTCF